MADRVYTAADVRAVADDNRHDAALDYEDWRCIVAMLDAFADRLEADAGRCTCGHVASQHHEQRGYCHERCRCTGFVRLGWRVVPDNAEQAWREDGRREILAEVAKLDCVAKAGPFESTTCFFCESRRWEGEQAADHTRADLGLHAPDCLWRLAKEAK